MANMANGTSIKGMLQGMACTGPSIVEGTVTSVSPLKIKITNDEKLTITENITIVPWQLTDYETELTPLEWTTEEADGHRHEIKGKKKIIIHNALKVGDKLNILVINNGKLYYILDRVK